MEPGTVRSGRAEMEGSVGQHGGRRPWHWPIDNDGCRASREAHDVIGRGHQFEDNRARYVWWPIINRHHGERSRAFAGGDSYGAGQGDVLDSVACGTADGII